MKNIFICLFTAIFVANAQVEELLSANNLFAASLYKEISRNNTNNFLMSPLSVELVFSLIRFGAKGKTAKELEDGLHLPEDQQKIRTAIKTLIPSLLSYEPYYKFTVANKVYVLTGFQLKEEFLKIAVEDFFSEIESIDFLKKTEAVDTINKWVEGKTNNKIQNLLSPDAIDDSTRAVLVNALYFQALWLEPFFDHFTKKKNFYLSATNAIQVPTMHNSGFYDYAENTELNAIFLEIPFETENVSMVFILPNDKEGLASLENQVEKVLMPQKFSREVVNVGIPKFKIESSFDLKELLKRLGVVEVFGKNANLTGMSDRDLYISKAIQKTFIKVKEEGVEAAAATYAVAIERIGTNIPPPTRTFHADHPFMFYIKANDAIIFVGRIYSPNIEQ